EILGRPARRHPHDARRRDEGGDEVRKRYCEEGKRRSARGGESIGQNGDHRADAGGESSVEEGGGCRRQRKRIPNRQGHHRSGLQGDGVQAVSASSVARRSKKSPAAASCICIA